jgi:peptidyl-prolyl cis-trans isomerase C
MKNYLMKAEGQKAKGKTFYFLLFTCCFFLAACNSAAGPDVKAAEPNASAQTAVEQAKARVAVTVNGVDINESDIEAQTRAQLEKMGAQVPPAFAEQYKKQLRQRVLEQTIIEQLLDEKVKAEKIVVTDEEIIDQIKEMASQQGLSLGDFKALIEAYGSSFDEWKQQMQFRKGLGYKKLLEAQFAGKINVTEDDARKYYSENKKRFETSEQVRASHILITPEAADPNADPNEPKAKARAKARSLLKQIKDGADFAELAKANSACPSAAKGGDLNFFGRGRMAPAFEKAAFELKAGQVSDIVETRFGYHIIKVADRKEAGVTTFEQAKDNIVETLTQKRQGELAKEYIESLKAKANIVYPAGEEPKAPASPPITAPSRPRPTPQPKDKTAE